MKTKWIYKFVFAMLVLACGWRESGFSQGLVNENMVEDAYNIANATNITYQDIIKEIKLYREHIPSTSPLSNYSPQTLALAKAIKDHQYFEYKAALARSKIRDAETQTLIQDEQLKEAASKKAQTQAKNQYEKLKEIANQKEAEVQTWIQNAKPKEVSDQKEEVEFWIEDTESEEIIDSEKVPVWIPYEKLKEVADQRAAEAQAWIQYNKSKELANRKEAEVQALIQYDTLKKIADKEEAETQALNQREKLKEIANKQDFDFNKYNQVYETANPNRRIEVSKIMNKKHIEEGEKRNSTPVDILGSPAMQGLAKVFYDGTVMVVPWEEKLKKASKNFGNWWSRSGNYSAKRDTILQWLDRKGDKCDSCEFIGDYTFQLGSRSGTLIQKNWVLTAGHNLELGEKVVVLGRFTAPWYTSKIYYKHAEKGWVRHVEYGSGGAPDYALIKLKHGYLWNPMNMEDRVQGTGYLSAAGHQLGMEMIVDPYCSWVDTSKRNWRPYYFQTDLQMYSGNSGSPVVAWEKDAQGNLIHRQFKGIVVGSGGMDDFVFMGFDQYGQAQFRWNTRPVDNSVGVKVLEYDPIRAEVNDFIKTFKKKPMRITATPAVAAPVVPLQVASIGARGIPIPSADWQFSLDKDSVYVYLDRLIIEPYGQPLSKLSIPLNQPVTVRMCGSLLEVWKNRPLATNYDELDYSRYQVHAEVWPMDLHITGKPHHLKFVYQADSGVIGTKALPYLNGERYNLLDGIGASDIVDELPRSDEYNRHFMWLCDCEFIELSVLSLAADGTGKPAILIRSVKPFVPIYTRTETPTEK